MKKIIGILTILAFLSACRAGDEVFALETGEDTKLSWTFIQFNVPEDEGETETYFLYAQISKRLLKTITNNQIEHGFIFLKNVRYWGDNNTIHEYRDGENTGELVYRIEDIRRIKLLHAEPKVGMGYEQFNKQEEENEKSEEEAKPKKADNKL
jgi:hypothetical protein